jgi:hypothetical protein
MLVVDRIGLPPSLLAALKHVASLHNPDFYEKERNRLLAATLFAHEPAAFGEHDSAGLYDHGGPLAASMSTISPG